MRVSGRTIGLVGLACAALVLRIWVVLALSTETARPLAYEHGRIAENLVAGKGFTIEFLGTEGPTSQQAPFYPVLLAASYACFGVNTPHAILAVQLLQCLAGTALVLVVFWLTTLLVPDRPIVGWVAAGLAAIFPTHLYATTHLQVAIWAALVLTLLMAVVLSPRWRRTWPGAFLSGGLAGLLLLIEPILALALPIAALAFWMSGAQRPTDRRPIRQTLGQVAAMAGVACMVIMPWLVRNYLVHGEFVFIKSSFGYAFWQGNNPLSWGTDKVPKPTVEPILNDHDGSLADMNRAMWEARHETLYIDDVLLKPTGYRSFAGLSEPERSRQLGRQAWDFIESNPGQYVRLCLNRLRYFMLFDETNPKAANRIYRLSTVMWLVLSALGLMISLDRRRQLWPTYAVFAAVLAFHSLVIVSTRFRIPVEPLSLVWMALAVVRLTLDFAQRSPIRVYRPGERPALGHKLQGPHFDKKPVRHRAGRLR